MTYKGGLHELLLPSLMFGGVSTFLAWDSVLDDLLAPGAAWVDLGDLSV